MAGCCDPRPYERLFGRKTAERDARRYRRKGLSGTAHDLVELAGDVTGATILDVGGGIGGIELDLLAAGAVRATNVELSGGYEDAAARLIDERGVSDRVERRLGDFVTEDVDPHDVVVMHRVVCCYPDLAALMGAGAERARRSLLLTYPRQRLLVRAGARIFNTGLAAVGSSFRMYIHPFAQMCEVAGAHGLSLETRRPGAVWESAAFVRA